MRRLLYFIFSLVPFLVSGQTKKISGTVADANGAPLQSVTVCVLSESGDILQYAQTDLNGRFLLEADELSASKVSFSSIGYQTVVLPCDKLPEMNVIRLAEEDFNIPEVVVSGSPILAHGDTISYSVGSFKSAQDRTVSDVLKKMPGIEVSKNGSIQYQGKDISTVYVEGLDLTGGRYAQVTENLSADKVRSIQVFENHQRVKSLRDINHSDRAALNLTLKDGAKGVSQWLLDMSAGHFLQEGETALSGNARVMQMRFRKSFQQVNLYKNDYLGNDISSETRLFDDDGFGIENSLLSSVVSPVQGIDQERYSRDDSHLVSTNVLWKGKRDAISRLQGGVYTNRVNTTQNIVTDYFLGDTVVSVLEQHNARQRHSEVFGEYQYSENNDIHNLENIVQFYGDFDRERAVSQRNGMDVLQDVSPRQYYIRDRFSAVRTTEVGRYVLNAGLSFNHLPGRILVKGTGVQHLSQDAFHGRLDLMFAQPYYKTNIIWRVGMDGTAGLYAVGMDSLEKHSDGFGTGKIYASCGVSYKADNIRFSASVPLSLSLCNYGESCGYSKVYISPVAFCEWQISRGWRTLLTARHNLIPGGFQKVWNERIFTSYMSSFRGNGANVDEESLSGLFSLQYRDALAGLFCNLSANYTGKIRQPLVDCTIREDGFVDYRVSDQTGRSWNTNLSGSISKSLTEYGLTMGVKGAYIYGATDFLSAGRLGNSTLSGYTLGGSMSVSPTDWLSLDLKGLYSHQRRNYAEEKEVPVKAYVGEYNVYFIAGSWQMEISGNQYINRLPEKVDLFFWDAAVSYKFKNVETGIYAKNLTGIRNYVRTSLSDFSSTTTVTVVRPREIFLKVSVGF